MSTMSPVYKWAEIDSGNYDSILLGNGASIAINPCFSYSSLFESACNNGFINSQVEKVFEYFDTVDFELVLQFLWHTHHINQALDIDDKVSDLVYESVKKALIQSVRLNHASFEDVKDFLPSIVQFLKKFKKVITLNYDLTTYWAMLEGNDTLGNWFKDCFLRGGFESDWEHLMAPYHAEGSTLVFYPHGSLVLASRLNGQEWKINKGEFDESILETIFDVWEQGNALPIFVSEGDSAQKVNAITRSDYLSTVYHSVLPEVGPNIVIYGLGFNDNDDHILKAIGRKEKRELAISVYCKGRKDDEINEYMQRVRLKISKFFKGEPKVLFFDALSKGCWIYAE